MAIKGPRNFSLGADSEISYFMNEAAEAGIIVVYTADDITDLSLDNAANEVAIPTDNDDGYPAGLLLQDVLDLDLTYSAGPLWGTQALVGEKVELAKGGWYQTDKLKSGDTPERGEDAYYAADGELSTSGIHRVGEFESGVNSEGFVRVRIQLN